MFELIQPFEFRPSSFRTYLTNQDKEGILELGYFSNEVNLCEGICNDTPVSLTSLMCKLIYFPLDM